MTLSDGPATAPDQPEPTAGTGSARPEGASRAEGASSLGSVAEEAALLIDLLSQRTRSDASGMPSPGSADAGSDRKSDGRSDGRSNARPGVCTCGGTTPAACRVCPVCQLIAFVQQVNPDTIDKVADFVGFAATALRDLATAQRERRAEPAPDRDTDRDDAHPSADADDIDADDIDADENGPGGSA